MSIYTDKGHESRAQYLEWLALDLGVPEEAVLELAELLGPEEDFDGLISTVEDYYNSYYR